ncbi:adenylate cyclase [Candidatus Vecturithrix granuli]|uniref:Adenylate cyclase n=1 Tax=Vecturithrix granuli TaxID=1499967 RepID=A0A081BYI3_VECG1|nr:adenylate cyclase [Candidatus Vecturithrix granuli]
MQNYQNTKQQYILCIDDEPTILESLYTQLSECFKPSYEIECAESGHEALQFFDEIYKMNSRVILVLCDQLMPDMLGQYVLEHIYQRDKRVINVLLTGQAGLEDVTYCINHAGLQRYIEKPWDKQDLLLTVENLLNQSQISSELDRSRLRYERILQSMNNGVISLDFQGKITAFNQAASHILGIDSQLAIGKSYASVFFGYPGNDEMNDTVIQAIKTWDSPIYREIDFLRKDGIRAPLALMSSTLRDADDSEMGVLIVLHDLSEARQYSTLKTMFSRYVAKQVVENIVSSGNLTLHGEKRNVSILFSDIRGFTSMTEQLEPTQVVSILNAYFSEMIDIIYQYEGMLDKFLGDGIMCIFGAPIDQPDHAVRAACTALAMQHTLEEFNQRQHEQQQPLIKIGIGINSGDAVVGNVGSEKRLEYTAIGDNVNLAARLQAIASGGQILISESTYQAIKHVAEVQKLEPVKIKGKEQEVQVYELQDVISL